ncbi:HlyD family type I secretion periplasmic adaptor subunit [Tropicimonas marinistellae]|uniref:HlyD family type I secretion periplasmic adaptor subunit n=1 Tax=Tropicimonas marinistellae TaxID=1739787 RepID=UPI00082F3C52|nr:HlyD family type I secretion periplasmic adaptor subunit [Tropicimonas marinistellae]
MSYVSYPSPALPAAVTAKTPRDAVRGPRRVGMFIILLFLAGFGGWGGFAPLAGGTYAHGTIVPYGSVRTVQHLEGGIARKILVQNGDVVEVGTPLIEMKQTAPEAEVAALTDRYRARAAEAARLEAELSGAATVTFPAELSADPDAVEVIAAERRIMGARIEMIAARKHMLRQQIQQLEQQITGYVAQLDSSNAQLDLVLEEIADKQKLLDQGLTPKVEMLRLKREAAQIGGYTGQYTAAIAAARQSINEAEVELKVIDAERMEAISQRAGQIRGELAEIEQQLEARRDVLARTVVTAPVSGVIANLRIKTEGGVIGAGQPVLDIVPTQEKLVIEANVSPQDIDLVKNGMEVHVQFSALSTRSVSKVNGIVTEVSADTQRDQVNGGYYSARVEVAQSEIDEAGATDIQVGMPAEVLIVAHERTMLQYVMQPFTDALWRAGREI